MICRSCKRDNPEEVKYCEHCGEFLTLDELDEDIDLSGDSSDNKIELRAKRRAIERLADKNPKLAAKVLKTWLNDDN